MILCLEIYPLEVILADSLVEIYFLWVKKIFILPSFSQKRVLLGIHFFYSIIFVERSAVILIVVPLQIACQISFCFLFCILFILTFWDSDQMYANFLILSSTSLNVFKIFFHLVILHYMLGIFKCIFWFTISLLKRLIWSLIVDYFLNFNNAI